MPAGSPGGGLGRGEQTLVPTGRTAWAGAFTLPPAFFDVPTFQRSTKMTASRSCARSTIAGLTFLLGTRNPHSRAACGSRR